MSEDEEKMPLTGHLEDLRRCVIVSFVAIGIGFVLSYGFKEKIFEILTMPLIKAMKQDQNMIFTSLPEAFFTYLKVSFITGLILATPVILYEFWIFIAPGLYKNEKKVMIPIVILSTFFFVGGALFGYFIVFPYGFEFFLGFANQNIKPMPSMKEYLSLSSKLLFAFGFIFELPLVITFLARLGVVTVPMLKKNRKYAILIFFVGAALLTPPDVITQMMMAMPLMILYEMSILSASIFGKGKKDPDEEKISSTVTKEEN